MASDTIAANHSTTHGAAVNGAKLTVGFSKIPAGTGAKPHAHPDEQVNAVVSGRTRFRPGEEERVAGPGGVILVSPDTEHQTTAIDDVEFFNYKGLVPGFSVHEGGWVKGRG